MAVAGDPASRRVLILSADIGGGHDATGRALDEEVRRLWPGSRVRWVDTLDAMGPGVGAAFRWTYRVNVEHVPWLYEYFYACLWRWRWFAESSKRFVGAWAGRRLAPIVAEFGPDLILSTYPLATAGLCWLRRRRGVTTPTGAWVSDFAPHPMWVYRDVDLTFVMNDAATPLAFAAEPQARVRVSALPVVRRFHPGPPGPARAAFGLPADRLVALVTCGSYSFGAVREAVAALLTIPEGVHVAVVCGRDAKLAAQLAAAHAARRDLTVFGWVDDMPELMRAADVVVTNAGGATVLEALATERPIVMYRPIAAHGAANAALLDAAGLSRTCRRPDQLARAVGAMRSTIAVSTAAGPTAAGPNPGLGAGAGLGTRADLGVRALAQVRAGPGRPEARIDAPALARAGRADDR